MGFAPHIEIPIVRYVTGISETERQWKKLVVSVAEVDFSVLEAGGWQLAAGSWQLP